MSHLEDCLRRDWEARREEYNERANCDEQLLSRLGVSLRDDFCLAGVASLFDLETACPLLIVSKMSELCEQEWGLESEIAKRRQSVSSLEAAIRTVLGNQQRTSDEGRNIQAQAASMDHDGAEKKSKMKLMQAKANEYALTTRHSKQELLASGVNTDLTHDALLSLSHRVEETEHQTSKIMKTMLIYNDLPPDIVLARQRLAEKRREVELLERRVNSALGALDT